MPCLYEKDIQLGRKGRAISTRMQKGALDLEKFRATLLEHVVNL